MYKGIIFDLDGTLLDTSEGVLASIRHTIKTMNYRELPLETLLTFIGPPVKRSLMNHYGLTDQEADEATEVFRQQYKNKDLLKAKPYDGILELLKALKDQGFLVGVATLKREDYAHTILEHFGIAKLCDLICGSDFESRMTKTDVLRKCLSKSLPERHHPSTKKILFQTAAAFHTVFLFYYRSLPYAVKKIHHNKHNP